MIKKLDSLIDRIVKIIDTKEYSMTMKEKINEAAYGENPDDRSRYFGLILDDVDTLSPKGFELVFENIIIESKPQLGSSKIVALGEVSKVDTITDTGTMTIKYGDTPVFKSKDKESNIEILDKLLKKEKELNRVIADCHKEDFLNL